MIEQENGRAGSGFIVKKRKDYWQRKWPNCLSAKWEEEGIVKI